MVKSVIKIEKMTNSMSAKSMSRPIKFTTLDHELYATYLIKSKTKNNHKIKSLFEQLCNKKTTKRYNKANHRIWYVILRIDLENVLQKRRRKREKKRL